MNRKDHNIIGNITIPSLGNKNYNGVHLISKTGENPVLSFQIDESFDYNKKIPVILGIFTGIGDVTFIDCFPLGINIGASGTIVKYSATKYITGYQIYNPEDIEIDSFIIEIPSLVNWFRKSCISHKIINNQENIILTKQDAIDIQISESTTIKFEPICYQSWNKNSITIEESVLIHFIAHKIKFQLNELYIYLHKILKFLIFIQKNDPVIKNISLILNDLTFEIGKSKHLIPLSLFTEPLKIKPINSLYNVYYDSYVEIQNEFKTILINWFNDSISSPIDLLLSKALIPNLNSENHFLNICFATESFHRLLFNNKTFSDEDFKKRIEYINENVNDSSLRKWLNEKLKYANEPSFRRRLKDFKNSFEILEINNFKELIDSIVETRNYLVHRDIKLNKILKGKDLFYATCYLEIILKINILKELGFSYDSYINKLKVLSSDIKWIKNVNKE